MTYSPPILFPSFLSKPIWRELGLLKVNQVETESQASYLAMATTELAALLHEENLLVWTGNLLSLEEFPWFIENCEVFCNKRAEVMSIRLHYPRGTRWIGSSNAWGYKEPSPAFLASLRTVFETLQAGTYQSPGATGMAFLRKTWVMQFGWPEKEAPKPTGWKAHRHQRPPESACLEMKRKGTGARSDLLTHEQHFTDMWELDEKNAYGRALARPQPTGKTSRFLDGCVDGYEAYVADCQVTIVEQLRYGLFPVREKEQVVYPTQPGTYLSWLFSAEIDLCREKGLTVEVGDGWGWYQTTTDLAYFAREMARFRDEARPEVASLLKLITVATIGRFGMDSERYTLTTEGEDGVDVRIGAAGRATTYFLHRERVKRPETMPHWYWHVCALVRLDLTREVLRWIEQEDQAGEPLVLATNTDAVLLSSKADVSAYPPKGAGETRDGWQSRRLHTVTLPALRHLTGYDERGEYFDHRPGRKKQSAIRQIG